MAGPLHPLGTTAAQASADATELEALSKRRGDRKPHNAVEAAKNFESLMVTELLKTMRATIPENENGFAMNTVWGMFDDAISKTAAGGLGLAPMLARDLGASEEEVRTMTRMSATPSGPESRLRLDRSPTAPLVAGAGPTKAMATPDKPVQR
ncbi:MAG: rod-binding protein, partial [Nannocystaceae bacterium]